MRALVEQDEYRNIVYVVRTRRQFLKAQTGIMETEKRKDD